MHAPGRTRTENAALVLTLAFGVIWVVLGVVELPDEGELTPDALVPMLAATPALLGAMWALTVRRGGRTALMLGMVLAFSVVIVFAMNPVTFLVPVAVLLLLTADWSAHVEPAHS